MERIPGLIILLYLLFVCAIPCMAQQSEESTEPNAILVSMHDGSSVIYSFRDKPTITFDGDRIVFACENYTTEHALCDMKHYSFVYDPSGIIDAVKDISMVRDGDIITVQCRKASTVAALYNAAGQLVVSSTADTSGVAQLSLTALPPGVYLLTFDGKSSKIIKR